jgi:hypothetical protein
MDERRLSSSQRRIGTASVTTQPVQPAERWTDYALTTGDELRGLWTLLLESPRDILFILGKGFDPRMLTGIELILGLGGGGKRDCIVVEPGDSDPGLSTDLATALDNNFAALERLLQGRGSVSVQHIQTWSEDGRRRVGPRNLAGVFGRAELVAAYSDVIIDISALPRSLYASLIAIMLQLIDNWDGVAPNLHVLVADDPVLDKRIVSEGLDDEASYLHGFGGGVELEATAGVPRVWIPILGERKLRHFERIHTLVSQEDSALEIAPALPFECSDPRRTDDLLLEYREHLFDRLRIEAGNIVHVPERNPFGVYRQLINTSARYTRTLEPLGGCKIILSMLSSKLLSVGAILAAYELKQKKQVVAIAHVQSGGYSLEMSEAARPATLFHAWLTGDCYAN